MRLARAAVPGVKLILFADSMGSFMAQRFIELHGGEIDGVVLSGSSGAIDNIDGTIDLLDMIGKDAGMDSSAPLFAGFNDQFEGRTEFDWLSRATPGGRQVHRRSVLRQRHPPHPRLRARHAHHDARRVGPRERSADPEGPAGAVHHRRAGPGVTERGVGARARAALPRPGHHST